MVRMDARELEAALRRLDPRKVAEAEAAAINARAKAAHSRSERNIRERLTLRNSYTLRSLKFSPAKVRSSGKVGFAITGSRSPYLPLQEKGGTVRAQHRKVPIPTKAIRLGKKKSGVVMTKFRLRNVGDIRLPSEKGKKIDDPSRMFFANFRKPGFYFRSRKKLIMARDLSRKSYRVRPTKWHSDAVKQFGSERLAYTVYVRELRRRLGK